MEKKVSDKGGVSWEHKIINNFLKGLAGSLRRHF